MIKTVISDLGKVILWFDNTIFLRKLAAHGRRDLDSVRTAAHENLELVRGFDTGTLEPREFYERTTGTLGIRIGCDLFYKYYCDIFWPNPPVLDLFRRLKSAGRRLVLLSNTDVMRFGFIRARFPEALVFDDYVLSYEVKLLKPDPAIYLEAVRRAGCPAGECVHIDDLAENVAGARAAGLHGIVYDGSTDLEAELGRLGVTG